MTLNKCCGHKPEEHFIKLADDRLRIEIYCLEESELHRFSLDVDSSSLLNVRKFIDVLIEQWNSTAPFKRIEHDA